MSDTEQPETATHLSTREEPVRRDLLLSAGVLGVVALTFALTTLLTHL